MGTGWTREMCWRSGGGEVTTILSNRKSVREGENGKFHGRT